MRMLTWMHIIIRDEDNELLVLFCKVYGIIVCVLLIDALAEEAGAFCNAHCRAAIHAYLEFP